MLDFTSLRHEMVSHQIYSRGVRDERVLAAMRLVPRHSFLPVHQQAEAYEDRPIVIAEGLVLAQPSVIAVMLEALALTGEERVLEVGAGAGYIAALLGRLAREVLTIEPHGPTAQRAAEALADSGSENVRILHASGAEAWREMAPFDAILVSGNTPDVPEVLKAQLALGGRLVVPVGADPRGQQLVRVTRLPRGQFNQEDLADLRYVPRLARVGWEGEQPEPDAGRADIYAPPAAPSTLPGLIAAAAEPFETPETADLAPLLDRIGDRRLVLIGESTHGTSEFYRFRARLTRRLIEEKGFAIVAAEADWPDAARIDHFVRHRTAPPAEWEAFARFPTWMWRNQETHDFITWLREWNASRPANWQTGFYGLDLYSLFASTRAVVTYLTEVDPALAEIARARFGCLHPWEADPAAYGHAAITGAYHDCADQVVKVLADLHRNCATYVARDGERLFDATQNAYVAVNAERYYRVMYFGSRASWNLRDGHMFETLQNVMAFHGDASKAIVWAHNSHVGDARATEMSRRGENNLGELCARGFGMDSYRIGFGTDHGEVAAASQWGGPMEVKKLRPSHRASHERQFHLTQHPGLILPLQALNSQLAEELSAFRLQRAVGVIYRPESELASHYFGADLRHQFDEYVWLDRTHAVEPLDTEQAKGLPDTYPFAL